MDDSIKNVRAVAVLQKKYPDVRIKSVLAVEHLTSDEKTQLIENYIEESFKRIL